MAHPQLTGKARADILAHHRALGQPCGICGLPIPPIAGKANQRHPLGMVVDEIVPRSHGGSSVDVQNTRALHRWCNGSRSNRDVTPEMVERCRAKIEELMAEPVRHVDVSVDWYNP